MASQAIKEQETTLYQSFTSSFKEQQQRRDFPGWVERLRESAFERFSQLGFPTVDDEDWKYTNVASVAKGNFRPAADGAEGGVFQMPDVSKFVYAESVQSRLVFINGIFKPELSSLIALPPTVRVSDLGEALLGNDSELVREHLGRRADYDGDAFTALNTAFVGSGAFILIPKNTEVEAPVQLLFLSDSRSSPIASFPRVLVIAEQNSSATVIETYAGIGDGEYLTNAVVEMSVAENARLTHYKVQRETEKAYHIAHTHAHLARHCVYNSTTITLGARLSRHGIGVRLEDEGIECHVDGLYIVDTNQHADTHSLIDHQKPHCTSYQLYKGILAGRSRAVFNGRIFVHPGAQKTDAYQTNRNLLLSPDARVDTKPQLEIFADDVKCSHGATVGQLDEEELFYLISRGLRPEIARNLLTYGFAEEVVEKINISSIRDEINEVILKRLDARLEL